MPTSLRLTVPRLEDLDLPASPAARPSPRVPDGGSARGDACLGLALFPTREPPSLAWFERLAVCGVEVERLPDPPGTSPGRWALRFSHPSWGQAQVVRHPALQPPSPLDTLVAPGLTPRERQRLFEVRSVLGVSSDAARGDVYRDRKDLLRWLRFIVGTAGVGALDCSSELMWSPAALDEELSHGAALDVASLYVVHAVVLSPDCAGRPGHPDSPCPICRAAETPQGAAELRAAFEKDAAAGRIDPTEGQRLAAADPTRLRWIHTHGLASLGAFDFDVLRPAPDALKAGPGLLRHIAHDILEGRLLRDSPRHPLSLDVGDVGDVAMVPVAEFMRRASAEDRALRDADATHASDRSVLCDPAEDGSTSNVRPATVLSDLPWEGIVYPASSSSCRRFADRAVGTLPLFRALCEEFAALGVVPFVQFAIPNDDEPTGAPEPLWFGVHGLRGDSVDATLVSRPRRIDSLARGDRAEHGLDLLVDWMIDTPCGDVTAHGTAAARALRELRPTCRGRR